MPEPIPSTLTSAGLAAQSIGAAVFAGALTGLDYWVLLGGFAGALLALRKQEPQGPYRALLAVASVSLLALFATWFAVETLPALARAAGTAAPPEIGKGRALLAWAIGYYAQADLLPAGGLALRRLLGRVGGGPVRNEDGER